MAEHADGEWDVELAEAVSALELAAAGVRAQVGAADGRGGHLDVARGAHCRGRGGMCRSRSRRREARTAAELERVVAAAAHEVARGGGQRGVRVAGERAAALVLAVGALDQPAAVAHRHAQVAAPQAHCSAQCTTSTC